MTKIAVFSSGQGTTFNHLIQHFNGQTSGPLVSLLITDRDNIEALNIAEKNNIAFVIAKKSDFEKYDDLQDFILTTLAEHNITFIVLAGYLKKISSQVIDKYEGKIINTHPSLLPKYGGIGMYGKKIHEAVIQNKDSATGVTVHRVNNEYDQGEILAQQEISVSPTDSSLTIEQKVKALEKSLLVKTIEDLL